jgi:radical SAM protein with 4Fe4S-binding SPASM domain
MQKPYAYTFYRSYPSKLFMENGALLKKKPNKEHLVTSPGNIIAQIKAVGLHPPHSMTLMVTDKCNLFCRHCWLDCCTLDKAAPVPARKITDLADAFAKLGGTRINLTGGEVLSHPEWHSILTFCTEHSRIDGVCLQTNGILLTHEKIKALQNMRTDKLTIQVSLDGARARTHDIVRGPGSFFRAMAGLRLLAGAGLGQRTQVAFTEMAHNIHELPELLEKLDDMGIGRLVSGTVVLGGRAAASKRIGLPMPVQFWELIDYYQSDAIFKALYDRKANVAAIEWFKNRTATSSSTCSCLKHMFVDARGYLYPCTMLLLDRYAVEGAYTQPLNRTLQKALSKWREIPILSRKRHRRIASCSRCAFKDHCAGGCMGRAAAVSGELMVPEDRCALRKAVYQWTKLPGVASFCHRS